MNASCSAPVIAGYVNGGFEVSVHADGTKLRIAREPEVPPQHPEQLDLKITDFCDAACAWCHEGSTKRGRHGDVDAMLSLLSGLPAGVEIAIGGGDPLSHPEFPRLARGLRRAGLIPSVTVNGRHLDRHRSMLKELTSEGSVFGVGVSFAGRLPDWDYPHLVLHMIAGVDDPAALDAAAPRKVLVLGYKTHGRGQRFRAKRSEAVEANLSRWYRELVWMAREHHLSFDTLAISQMNPERLFRSSEAFRRRHMGEEGQFSMYVDGVKQEYAMSSYSPERRKWTDIRAMFADVRRQGGMQHA